MALQNPWLAVLVNMVTLLIGANAGYYFGVKLLRRQSRKEDKTKKRETIESILQEVKLHKSSLEAYPQYEHVQSDEVRVQPFAVYPDSVFKNLISSGMFHLLSIELQRMLVEHYHHCDMINAFQREGTFTWTRLKEANYQISMINRYLTFLKPDEIIIALESELHSKPLS
jgi:uncharacterized protein YneF (UPF0154 family)